jgi:hypothetical protein
MAIRIVTVLFMVLPATLCCAAEPQSEVVSLDGEWRFYLDRGDRGLKEQLFSKSLPETVRLPGTLPGQGIGDEITVDTRWTGEIVDKSFFTSAQYEEYRRPGNVKVPFWLQPDRYYAGAAWYQRDFQVPPHWKGKRIVLLLERPHWETRVWVDGEAVGSCTALGTPHEYDLGRRFVPGRHTLTIRVDNRMVVDVGENSHSVSDHTQGNWNGIVGRLELSATPPAWIADLQVFPHVAGKSATVRGRIGNATGNAGRGSLTLSVRQVFPVPGPALASTSAAVTWDAAGGTFQIDLPALAAESWDEFNPALYEISASLDPGGHARSAVFGMREISTQGTQFLINGRKVFFRGTLECAIFPRTGHPPVEVEPWRRIIGVAKAHGLNNIRFHSWCPPEAAFVAADELGFYLHVECSSWANGSTTLGDGAPVDRWIYEEADRILAAYGNHPSFVLMPYGNEPGGKNHAAFLAKWVMHYRAADPRRLYTSGAGWPQIPENQFHLTPDPRVQAWGAGLKSRINARPPETTTDYRDYVSARNVPVVSHEIGQWCVYPNFDEIPKYTGYLKPKNFEIFRERLRRAGMLEQAKLFLLASGKLQTLCYKEDIESALRTPGMGGFQLLDLHDFPGQGTALVGVLDPFWDSKGYVTPAEYSRFCNSTVPLARLPRRVFTGNEELEAQFEVAHFGPKPLQGAVLRWRLVDDEGKTVRGGRLAAKDVPVGNGVSLGAIRVDLGGLAVPGRFRLTAAIEGTPFENDWDLWVYPAQVPADEDGITFTRELNDRALAVLNAGGKVLLQVPPSQVAPDASLGPVALGFSSIFWNTAWTSRQAPHTLGILCDPKNPALADFPTEYHSNWQWWYVVTRAGAMILDGMPQGLTPIVQVIDDWFTARRLALVFEATVGKGKLVVCSVDLQENGPNPNPVLRQLRYSLTHYMAGPAFAPRTVLTPSQVRSLCMQ